MLSIPSPQYCFQTVPTLSLFHIFLAQWCNTLQWHRQIKTSSFSHDLSMKLFQIQNTVGFRAKHVLLKVELVFMNRRMAAPGNEFVMNMVSCHPSRSDFHLFTWHTGYLWYLGPALSCCVRSSHIAALPHSPLMSFWKCLCCMWLCTFVQ